MTVYEGGKMNIEVKVDAHPPPTITWYKDGVEVITESHGFTTDDKPKEGRYSLTHPRLNAEHAGSYKVTASNHMGDVVSTCTVVVEGKILRV